jgi:hypothetical protein
VKREPKFTNEYPYDTLLATVYRDDWKEALRELSSTKVDPIPSIPKDVRAAIDQWAKLQRTAEREREKLDKLEANVKRALATAMQISDELVAQREPLFLVGSAIRTHDNLARRYGTLLSIERCSHGNSAHPPGAFVYHVRWDGREGWSGTSDMYESAFVRDETADASHGAPSEEA